MAGKICLILMLVFSALVNPARAQSQADSSIREPKRQLPTENTNKKSNEINYVKLNQQEITRDCGAYESNQAICRVKRALPVAKIEAALAAGKHVWQEGNELIFAWRGEANSVEMFGGIQMPLSPVTRTDLWILVMRIPQIDKAVIGTQFIVSHDDKISLEPKDAVIWRGRLAPVAPQKSEILRGKLFDQFIESSALSEKRRLKIYTPTVRQSEKIAAVVYVADGDMVASLAKIIDSQIVSRKLPPLVLVGITPGERKPDRDPRIGDTRALEYLPGFGYTDERFEAHERFFYE